jgi:membrane associated rhomboid family serine protease
MSFYYRPNTFPPVVKNLIIINALIFVAQATFGRSHPFVIENLFALHDVRSDFFQPYQLVTYMFLHGSMGHILGNMLGLWVFGVILENHWGPKRFIQYYFLTGIGAALLHLAVLYVEMQPVVDLYKSLPAQQQLELVRSPYFVLNVPTLGASGAIFGILAGAGYLFPNTVVYYNFLIPIKMVWLAIIYAGLELMLAIQNSAGDSVAHFAHLGGAATGIIIILIWNKTNRKTLY